jgi:hypothetical protein
MVFLGSRLTISWQFSLTSITLGVGMLTERNDPA